MKEIKPSKQQREIILKMQNGWVLEWVPTNGSIGHFSISLGDMVEFPKMIDVVQLEKSSLIESDPKSENTYTLSELGGSIKFSTNK